MIAYIITFISFILDLFVSNYIPLFRGNSTLFFPMFTLTSLIITLPFFNNNNKEYLIYTFIFGVLFDICITSTFPLNTIIFMIVGYIIILMDDNFSYNIFINIIKLFVIIFIYDGLTYLVLLTIGYISYDFFDFIFKYFKSILLNLIYLLLLYNITNALANKYKIKRVI